MKTRSGFVSNSSSTSFTIIVGAKAFDKARESLSPPARELMDGAWNNPPVLIVEGKTLFDLSYIDRDGGYWQYMGNCKDGGREENYDLGKEIIQALKDNGAYVRTKSC